MHNANVGNNVIIAENSVSYVFLAFDTLNNNLLIIVMKSNKSIKKFKFFQI